MNTPTPETAPCYTPYRYTPQGILDDWTHKFVRKLPDFQGAVERMGVRAAAKMMKGEME